MQREAAIELGVNPWTVLNWEKGHTEPPIGSIPAILEYLGYDPFPKPLTLPERIVAKRRELGWSIETAARKVDVDPGTWGNWERGQMILYRRHRVQLAEFLGLSAVALNNEMSACWNLLHQRTL